MESSRSEKEIGEGAAGTSEHGAYVYLGFKM